jgi:hypothetical protein
MKWSEQWVEWSRGFYEDINNDGVIGDWTDLSTLDEKEKIKYDSLLKKSAPAQVINKFFGKQVVVKEDPLFKIISGSHPLNDLDSLSMNYMMNDLGFWKDHSMGPCSSRMGFMDGSEWLFEAHQGKRYKCISRSNPGQNSKYYLLGLLFFKVAKIDKGLGEIY